MGRSAIPYCDVTWEPVTGCTPDFPCWERCWARRQAHRRPDLYGRGPNGEEFWPTFHPERLDQPLHWREPRVVLVSAMGDLFSDEIANSARDEVFDHMLDLPHTWLVLTKRAHEMRRYFDSTGNRAEYLGQIERLWLGVSVTSQADADERLPILCATPAAHRWVSYEPAIMPLDLDSENADGIHVLGCGEPSHRGDSHYPDCQPVEFVVAGCETGPGGRETPCAWLRDVQEQCREAGVPCYVKQVSGEAGEPKVIHFEPRPGELPWKLRRKHD